MDSKNIIIQQPQAFDLVDRKILVAGVGVGFEGTISLYVSDGHFEVESFAMAGGTSLRQFQAEITIPDNINFELDRIFLIASDDTAGCEEAPCPKVFVPLLFAPRILENYSGYWNHAVQNGETLSSIAQHYYNDSSMWKAIYRANTNTINNPDIIFPGQNLRILRVD
ncbi:MAG TPA: LysM peptidoglycan-binding domain-containing protein [Campylobacterales bacterium]|nr:LysM peptidoglycan-binding domain-containing protein [Campylobacterales bacterium]